MLGNEGQDRGSDIGMYVNQLEKARKNPRLLARYVRITRLQVFKAIQEHLSIKILNHGSPIIVPHKIFKKMILRQLVCKYSYDLESRWNLWK